MDKKKNDTCPNCGYCPHCGQAKSTYPQKWWYGPYIYPYPVYNPPYQWTWTSPTITSNGDNTTSFTVTYNDSDGPQSTPTLLG